MIDSVTQSWIRNPSDQRAAENGCWFDLECATYPIWWIERYCRLYEGEWAGEPMRLRSCAECKDEWPFPEGDEYDDDAEMMVARAEKHAACVAAGHQVDWQFECIARMFGWQKDSERWGRPIRRFREASIWVSKKNKKALALDTALPTPTGWTTIGEIREGDVLYDENGAECRVTQVHPIDLSPESYRMEFSNGETVRCNAEHEWQTTVLQHGVGVGSRKKGWVPHAKRPKTAVRETRDIAETLLLPSGTRNHTLPALTSITCAGRPLDLDPYVLGVWLGDGDSDQSRITCHKRDVHEYRKSFSDAGYSLEFRRQQRYRVVSSGTNLRTALRKMGVLFNKHIPPEYLRASRESRIALLQGLMDTDGCIDKPGKCITFCGANPRLVQGVEELLASLGVKYRTRETRAKINGVDKGPCWWIQFHVFRDDMPVFRLPRKLERMRCRKDLTMRARSDTVQITACERIRPTPMRCITVDSPNGLFRFGKTMLTTHNSPTLAAIGLYLECGDGEPGQKVFFGAKDGKQAKDIAGKHAVEMVRSSKELSESCTINKVHMRITHEPSRSIMEPMSSSNARTQESKEGLNGCILIDETHVVDRPFIKRVKRAGISRSEPFHIEVSTAGNNPDGYGKERFDYASDVAAGRQPNEQLFVAIYAAPQDLTDAELAADPVKYGKMANPAWGHTVGEEEYLNDYHSSLRSISELAEFKMYRLDIWQQTANPWLKMSDWAGCLDSFTEEDLRGQRCIGGLDLSKTRDMSSLVLLFPEWGDGGLEWVRVLPYFWLPEDYARENADKASFIEWADSGHLILTPDRVIDYGWIRSEVERLNDLFDIIEIGYDDKFAEELTQMIEQGAVGSDGTVLDEGLGIPRCSVSQSWATTAGPTAELERMVIAGTFRHNGHPVMTWQAGHATYKQDHNGNKKIVKANGKNDLKKIDGIAASVTGLARVLDPENRVSFRSIYETPGSLRL